MQFVRESRGATWASLAAELADRVTRDFAKSKKALAPAHKDYTNRVSSEDMAVSLQTATLLHLLCRLVRPRSVLDLGSGFSSYVLRRTRAEHGLEMRLLSLDTDPEWLERSREYTREQGLPDDGFELWDEARDAVFDLVFLDMERPPRRNGFVMPTLQRFCRPGTLLLLDDLHMTGYRTFVLETLMGFSYCHLDCRCYTMDRFGRWASLFVQIA